MPHPINRRDLLVSGAAAATALSGNRLLHAMADQKPDAKPIQPPSFIWAFLIHLTDNMWCDWDNPEWEDDHGLYRDSIQFDDKVWTSVLEPLAKCGINMILIDVADGVKYESHPEIAVKDTWSTKRLKKELARLRQLGLEPIPKLNFSATHDAWMGPYSRCVSTDKYYAVCRDLIAELIDLFDKPRFFHLGMDEEKAYHQRFYEYVVIRQFDLWWRDFYFYVDQVTKGGARPWIWSDYVWDHPDVFFKKMPKSVLQSNWYYGQEFPSDHKAIKAYHALDEHGYDQIPTGGNWTNPVNFGRTVEFCREHLRPQFLKGVLQSVWLPMLEKNKHKYLEAIDQVRNAKPLMDGQGTV